MARMWVLVACFWVGHAVSPMEKVMSMLASMQSKLKADGETAEASYVKRSTFCDRRKRDLGYAIEDAEKTVEQLEANMAKANSEIEVMTSKLASLQQAIAKSQTDLSDASDLRSRQRKEHEAARGELLEAEDLLSRAMTTLKRKVSPSLLQQKVAPESLLEALGAVVDAAAMPHGDRESLVAFVESSHSTGGDIISVLEDMKTKAREELNGMVSEEQKSQHSFLMMKQSLEMQTNADEKEMEQAKAVKLEAQQAKATATTDLESSQKTLGTDKESLKKLEQSCQQAARDHEISSKDRLEDQEALSKAQELLGAPVLLQSTARGVAAVARGAVRGAARGDVEVLRSLHSLATKTRSAKIESLAESVESFVQSQEMTEMSLSQPVMEKVRKMIEKMIASMKKEAQSEQSKKAYCEEEKKKSKAKLEELGGKQDSLAAKVDKKTSEADTLKSEAVALQKELGQLKEMQLEMDQRRKEEKEVFASQKKDFEGGLESVRSAITLLRGRDVGQAVVNMLEVVEADFGKSLAQSESVEASRGEEYEAMTQQNALSKVQKEADEKFKSKTSADLQKAVLELAADSSTTKDELQALLAYKESLAKQCYDGGPSYEERKAQREEQIQGLKEALAALGEPVLLQLRGLRPHRA